MSHTFKVIFFACLALINFTEARAESTPAPFTLPFRCTMPKAQDLGMPASISIELKLVDNKLVLSANGKVVSKTLSKIKINSIDAIQLSLGYFREYSYIKNPELVTDVDVFVDRTNPEIEIVFSVYFNSQKQVLGSTFLYSGQGSGCIRQ